MNAFPIFEGPYHSDLLSQAVVLGRVIENLAKTDLDNQLRQGLHTQRFRRVVLTGMGSSLHACYPLHRTLSSAGLTSHWIETAELLLGFEAYFGQDSLLVAVSQSGESAEIASLMQRTNEFGHLIGITNSGQSRLAREANTVLSMEAGTESTVSCKTYLASLAVLLWLGRQLIRGDSVAALEELSQAQVAVNEYLSGWSLHVDSLIPQLSGVKSIFVTGRGDSLATAGTGGLILKESTRRHAEGMSAPAFRHGPLEMSDESVLVVIFEGNETTAPLNRRLAEDIVRGGGRAWLVGNQTPSLDALRLPRVPDSVLPIVEILPVQMLSLALAAREGMEAGRFVRATKITDTA